MESAEEISIGATMVTAVAALESLLKDLLPDGPDTRGGLSRLVESFLMRYEPSREDAQNIRKMVSKVGSRRNTFAHNLTGSFWGVKNPDVKFDAATMHDALFTVGEIAIALEALLPQD